MAARKACARLARMPDQPTKRERGGVGRFYADVVVLVLGVLAGLLPTGATPSAFAASDATPELVAPRTYHVKPPGGRKRPDRDKRLHISYDRGRGGKQGPQTGRLTMDVSHAKDILRLKKFGHGCTSIGGLTVVCKVGARYDSWTDWAGALPCAASGSEPGDTGELRMRYQAPDGSVSTATTRVVVGGPILEVRRPEVIDGVRPGADTEMDLTVRNSGETPAHGVALQFTVDSELPLKQKFANCRYSGGDSQQTAYCTFPDLRLRPGQTAVFTPGLRMRAPKILNHADLHQSAWPVDLGPYEDVHVPTGDRPGHGPELEPQLRSGGKGQWSDEADVWTEVRTDIPANYAAIGDRVRGSAGDKREVKVGARNDGPGDLGDGGTFDLVFTLPKGAEVLKEPMEEIDDDAYEPVCRREQDTYTCPLSVHQPGEAKTLPFTLRLGTGAAGTVWLKERSPGEHPEDPDRSDNTARVTVDPAVHTASASHGHPLAWAIGSGAAVLAAAGAMLLLRRKRRNR
ncbi:hypothetical protein [Streptomyces cucumeris]|uniref:hypothetical protein n=1 Tax=Streptomyces cucumeris TaxID=2962890 RepID=UPI003D712E74